MIAYEMSHEETMSPVDVIVGIERCMRDKGILSVRADASQVNGDEVVFQDDCSGKVSRVRVFLRALYQQDVEVLDLCVEDGQGFGYERRLILVFPEIDFNLKKSLEAHLHRIAESGGYHEISCFQYIPLTSGEKKAIALKKIHSVQRAAAFEPSGMLLPAVETVPLKSPGLTLSNSEGYNFHAQAALAPDELDQLLELGILVKKLAESRVSVDL